MFLKPFSTSVLSLVGLSSILLLYTFKSKICNFIWDLRRKQLMKQRRKIYIISEKCQWENICDQFINCAREIGSVGFDCEWIQIKGKRFPVALLQLASHTGICALIRLNFLKDNIPATLKVLLEDDTILKVGVGPDTDAHYLLVDYNIKVNSWLDVRHLAVQDVSGEECDRNKNFRLGLDALAFKHLNWKLNKSSRVQTSNWEASILSHSQIDYAAEDALAGIHIFIKLVDNLSLRRNGSWPLLLSSISWLEATGHALKQIGAPFSGMKFSKRVSADGNNKVSGGLYKSPSRPSKDLLRGYSLRKSPLYHNCQLWAPDGEPLCTCDPKKAIWYVEKGLGEYVTKSPLVVRLKFEPAGRPLNEGVDGQFYVQERSNECVVCGRGESYIRKSIVPHEYRRYFPEVLKDHQSHDVVLLCAQCHQNSNIKDIAMRKMLAEEFDAPIGTVTDVKIHEDTRLRGVKRMGNALLKYNHKLPLKRKEFMETSLKEFFGVDVVTDEHIEQAASLDFRILNSEYVPHGYKVYLHYRKIGLIQLEQRWRQWFLDSMEPQYLPENWSVSHNHEKLKMKMLRTHAQGEARENFKIALVGTDGHIELPNETNIGKTSNFYGLRD